MCIHVSILYFVYLSYQMCVCKCVCAIGFKTCWVLPVFLRYCFWYFARVFCVVLIIDYNCCFHGKTLPFNSNGFIARKYTYSLIYNLLIFLSVSKIHSILLLAQITELTLRCHSLTLSHYSMQRFDPFSFIWDNLCIYCQQTHCVQSSSF